MIHKLHGKKRYISKLLNFKYQLSSPNSLSPLEIHPNLPSLLKVMHDHYLGHLSRDENHQVQLHAQPMLVFTTRAGMAACLEYFFRSLVDGLPLPWDDNEKKILRGRIKCLHSRTQNQPWNRSFCENPNGMTEKVLHEFLR
jgi:hypothetical protein